ncbi:MAG: hypothetical protein M0P69_05610 [Bacteroidales bacterium]|nr:hypothetical protein [Bacteroidales bacterium]
MKLLLRTLIVLSILLTTGVITSAVADDDPKKNSTVDGSGWQKSACSKKQCHLDPIKFNLEYGLDLSKNTVFKLNIDTRITMIDCCTSCEEEYSWCNFNADHEAC